MVIVKLMVPDKEQSHDFANFLLDKKYTLTVFGSLFDSFHINSSHTMEHNQVYVLQFLTKSLLFSDIEAGLHKEFPKANFSICATPIVHLAIHLHEKIRVGVRGPGLYDEEEAT